MSEAQRCWDCSFYFLQLKCHISIPIGHPGGQDRIDHVMGGTAVRIRSSWLKAGKLLPERCDHSVQIRIGAFALFLDLLIPGKAQTTLLKQAHNKCIQHLVVVAQDPLVHGDRGIFCECHTGFQNIDAIQHPEVLNPC